MCFALLLDRCIVGVINLHVCHSFDSRARTVTIYFVTLFFEQLEIEKKPQTLFGLYFVLRITSRFARLMLN